MRIVITGGAGSIGSMVAAELCDHHEVVLFDNSEHGIHVRMGQFRDTVEYFLGDVRNTDHMEEAFFGADIVFHCAAYKHVPMCENFPNQATEVNYDGTCNAIAAAAHCRVPRFMFMSTDKTVNANCHMGHTKYSAEVYTLECDGTNEMDCSVVRSGNVLGSRGCFFDAAEEMILEGKEVPITDERMCRYIISDKDLARFIRNCLINMEGGEVFVPQMDEVNIVSYLKMKGMQRYKIIGIRDGEKLKEELFHDHEKSHMKKIEGGYIVRGRADQEFKQ